MEPFLLFIVLSTANVEMTIPGAKPTYSSEKECTYAGEVAAGEINRKIDTDVAVASFRCNKESDSNE